MSVYELTGRKALVTGGGRGLGAGMAEALARAGAAIVIATSGRTWASRPLRRCASPAPRPSSCRWT